MKVKDQKHIIVSDKTKKTLDKIKEHPRETYDDVINKNISKRNISDPDFTNEQMPLCRHIYTERESFDCWVIADTGGWLRLIRPFKNIGSNSESYMRSDIDKSVIKRVDSLDKISFKFDGSHLLDIRQSANNFPDQWKENKVPRVGKSTPEEMKEFFKKINKLGEKDDNCK